MTKEMFSTTAACILLASSLGLLNAVLRIKPAMTLLFWSATMTLSSALMIWTM
jgi:hypothetical protein